MNQKQIDTIKTQLTIKKGQPLTTSHKVAEAFDKRHDNVLRDIDELECTPRFRAENFEETVHFRPSPLTGGQIESRAFEMTKKGFIFLALAYRGQKAALLREAYIEAFEQMEEELARGSGQREALLVMELLRTNPLWADIRRYTLMGLKQKEICKLVDRCKDTVRAHTRRLRELGLLEAGTQTQKTRQLPLFGEVAR